MRGFTTELEIPTWLEIELRTRGRQLADARWTFFDEHLHCLRIGQGGTRRQSVLPVQLRRISGSQRGGDSSLSVSGGAVEQRAFRHDHYVAVSRGTPCSVKTSNSASHYEKARSYPLGHGLKSMRDERSFEGAFGED